MRLIKYKLTIRKHLLIGLVVVVSALLVQFASPAAYAAPVPAANQAATPTGGDRCGGGPGNNTVNTSIDIGCRGKGNPIVDMLFAFIRFLSVGVGLILTASIVYAGIQYSTSRGDPQATAKAKKRIVSTLTALLIFIFAYAILNYVVPSTTFGL